MDLRDLRPAPSGTHRDRDPVPLRGAVREVGKAMGLPEDVTAALAG